MWPGKETLLDIFLVTGCFTCRRKRQDTADGGPTHQIPGAEWEPRSPAVLLPPERQTAVQRKAEEEKSPAPIQSVTLDDADEVFWPLTNFPTAGHRAAGVHPRVGSAAV